MYENSTDHFHRYLYGVCKSPPDFTISSEYQPFKYFPLNWCLFDYSSFTAHHMVIQMQKQQNKEHPILNIGVSGMALDVFVKYLTQRFLSYEEVVAVLDFAWEIIFLSDYFGIEMLFQLVSSILPICMHKLENPTEEDYLYSFLYSVLYPMSVLSEKLFAIIMAIIG